MKFITNLQIILPMLLNGKYVLNIRIIGIQLLNCNIENDN